MMMRTSNRTDFFPANPHTQPTRNQPLEQFVVTLDVDYNSGDLFDKPSAGKKASPAECEEACVKLPLTCVAYSFYRGGRYEGQCWLKGLATATRPAAVRKVRGCVSSPRRDPQDARRLLLFFGCSLSLSLSLHAFCCTSG
jgi:hypothetical protein